MFTPSRQLAALAAVALFVPSATTCAQDSESWPRPPLQQPIPKQFQVPKPRLGIPELVPVAQVQVQTDPLRKETGVTIGAQAARQTTGSAGNTQVNGKIVRVERDHVIVET